MKLLEPLLLFGLNASIVRLYSILLKGITTNIRQCTKLLSGLVSSQLRPHGARDPPGQPPKALVSGMTLSSTRSWP